MNPGVRSQVLALVILLFPVVPASAQQGLPFDIGNALEPSPFACELPVTEIPDTDDPQPSHVSADGEPNKRVLIDFEGPRAVRLRDSGRPSPRRQRASANGIHQPPRLFEADTTRPALHWILVLARPVRLLATATEVAVAVLVGDLAP